MHLAVGASRPPVTCSWNCRLFSMMNRTRVPVVKRIIRIRAAGMRRPAITPVCVRNCRIPLRTPVTIAGPTICRSVPCSGNACNCSGDIVGNCMSRRCTSTAAVGRCTTLPRISVCAFAGKAPLAANPKLRSAAAIAGAFIVSPSFGMTMLFPPSHEESMKACYRKS
jgi:hypothetical protein